MCVWNMDNECDNIYQYGSRTHVLNKDNDQAIKTCKRVSLGCKMMEYFSVPTSTKYILLYS